MKGLLNKFGIKPKKTSDPFHYFHSYHYLRHNQRSQEHLTSLGLYLQGSTVLEVGAGIGDHTSYFIDRGCDVVTSEARQANFKILKARYPTIRVLYLDLDNPPTIFNEKFDIIYCYGTLYHLKKPSEAIKFMAICNKKMLLLSTCVSFGDKDLQNPCNEDVSHVTQSVSGVGCRPTRKWVFNQLKKYYQYVYLPTSQPNHEEFPLDWSKPELHKAPLSRAVFIASREEINNGCLKETIPLRQTRSS